MRIVCNDAFCAGADGTIHKLIVVFINGNQMPFEERFVELNRRNRNKKIGNIIRDFRPCLFVQNFPILIENIIADAKLKRTTDDVIEQPSQGRSSADAIMNTLVSTTMRTVMFFRLA